MDSRGASGTTMLLTIVAVAAIGGFLFWLHERAGSLDQDVQPVMEDTTAAAGGDAVTLERLRQDLEGSAGNRGDLDSVEVATRLSRAVFTVRVDSTRAFPVFLNTEILQRNPQVYGGDRVSVVGRIYTLNDSIRQRWIAQGALDSAAVGNLPQVPAFLLADSLEVH